MVAARMVATKFCKELAVKLRPVNLLSAKHVLPALGLACLLAAGCQDKKPATTESVTDLTAPTIAPAATATPVMYTPPVQAIAPEPIATANPTLASSITAGGSSYTVKPGDTLWKIAATHYGDGKKWKQIAAANSGLTPSKLKVGQTITLP
jgi:nucleoid-associated protein YgaU